MSSLCLGKEEEPGCLEGAPPLCVGPPHRPGREGGRSQHPVLQIQSRGLGGKQPLQVGPQVGTPGYIARF